MKLTFGKFRGCDLENVPTAYLCWALEEQILGRYGLTVAVRAELVRRLDLQQYTAHRSPSAVRMPAGIDAASVVEVVKAGRRALAKAHHPDHGGDVSEMQMINNTADWMEAALADVLGVRR